MSNMTEAVCSRCGGEGVTFPGAGTAFETCSRCGGAGYLPHDEAAARWERICAEKKYRRAAAVVVPAVAVEAPMPAPTTTTPATVPAPTRTSTYQRPTFKAPLPTPTPVAVKPHLFTVTLADGTVFHTTEPTTRRGAYQAAIKRYPGNERPLAVSIVVNDPTHDPNVVPVWFVERMIAKRLESAQMEAAAAAARETTAKATLPIPPLSMAEGRRRWRWFAPTDSLRPATTAELRLNAAMRAVDTEPEPDYEALMGATVEFEWDTSKNARVFSANNRM